MKRVLALPLALAVLIGLTVAHGGLWPGDRLFALGFWTLAALASAAGGSRLALRPALFLPLAASGLSLALAPIPILGADMLLTWLALTILALACADYIERDLVLAGVLAAAAAGAVGVGIEVAHLVGMIGRPGLAAGASGLMGGANVSGVVIALGIPALFAFSDRGRLSRGIVVPAALLFLIAVIFTGSRTAVLAALASLVLATCSFSAPWRRGLLAFGVALAVISVFLYLPKFLARLDPEFLTNAQRISMVRGVLDAFLERPFFGHGPWSFPVLGQAWLSWPKWELHPHSFPLRVLFESGLAGIAAWSLLAFALKNGNAGAESGAAVAGPAGVRPAAAMAFVLAVGSLTDDVLWLPALLAFFLSCLAALLPTRGSLPRWAALLLIIAAGPLVAVGPFLTTLRSIAVWPDPVGAIDRAIRTGSAPDYRGADRDPVALRIRAWQSWDRGERSAAEHDLLRALEADPRMTLGPHLLDLAYVSRMSGDETAARSWLGRARKLAPVLTARFLGESDVIRPTPMDWHYGIEFANADAVGFAAIPRWDDPMDWRYWRHAAAQALMAGDAAAARTALAVAQELVGGQYGRDPQLARIELELGPAPGLEPSSRAEWALELQRRIARRNGAAYPWRVFGPLIHRQPLSGAGENSPWWEERCGPRADPAATGRAVPARAAISGASGS